MADICFDASPMTPASSASINMPREDSSFVFQALKTKIVAASRKVSPLDAQLPRRADGESNMEGSLMIDNKVGNALLQRK